MKKPQKPLCELRDDERIIGSGVPKEHINPKSRSFKSKTPESVKDTKNKPVQ